MASGLLQEENLIQSLWPAGIVYLTENFNLTAKFVNYEGKILIVRLPNNPPPPPLDKNIILMLVQCLIRL